MVPQNGVRLAARNVGIACDLVGDVDPHGNTETATRKRPQIGHCSLRPEESMRARSAKTLERARNRTSDNMTRGVDGEGGARETSHRRTCPSRDHCAHGRAIDIVAIRSEVGNGVCGWNRLGGRRGCGSAQPHKQDRRDRG